ncbi:MAG TPA: hypothetical protein VLH59_16110 [Ignavibacteriaceae bacterium]|nr:hypothetical protein [Ignavibacteriaceae bacterium]
MKNLFKVLLSVLILSIAVEIKPAPFDTGMITLQQPDRTEFTGRIWGDEFFFWAETEDGYRFVQSGDDLKMPVKVRTKIIIGHVEAKLTSYEGLAGTLTSKR